MRPPGLRSLAPLQPLARPPTGARRALPLPQARGRRAARRRGGRRKRRLRRPRPHGAGRGLRAAAAARPSAYSPSAAARALKPVGFHPLPLAQRGRFLALPGLLRPPPPLPTYLPTCLPGTAAPAPPRPWRRAVDRATGRAGIDASDRQSALRFWNPPPPGGAAIGGSSRDRCRGGKTYKSRHAVRGRHVAAWGKRGAEHDGVCRRPPVAASSADEPPTVPPPQHLLAISCQAALGASPVPSAGKDGGLGDPMRFGHMKICMPHLSYF